MNTDKDSPSTLKYLMPVVLPILAGLAAAAFWDLPIDKALYSPGAAWAVLIERFGQIPGLLLSLWALLVLNAGLSGGRARRILLGLLNFLVCDLVLEYTLLDLACGALDLRKQADMINFAAAHAGQIRAVSATLVLAGMLLLKYFFRSYASGNRVFARVTTVMFAVSQVLLEVFKNLWGRVRFRDLAPGYSNFHVWYYPQGAAGNHSFPSGHTALAWAMLPAFLLFRKSPALRRAALWLSAAWGVTVALGRMTLGAHFLSDVLFASLITIVPFMLMLRHERAADTL